MAMELHTRQEKFVQYTMLMEYKLKSMISCMQEHHRHLGHYHINLNTNLNSQSFCLNILFNLNIEPIF